MSDIPQINSYEIPNCITPNVTNWVVDANRAALIFHDMQNYFLRPFSESSEPASALTENSIKLKQKHDQYGIPVAYTTQPGDMIAEEKGLLNDFWGSDIKASVEDHPIINPLETTQYDWLLTK